MNDLLLFEKFDKFKYYKNPCLVSKSENQRAQQFLIKRVKIPAILVTCLPIVNISLSPEIKRFLTPDKASVYKLLTHVLLKPAKATSSRS
jgi:hypothetical protein